MRMILLLVAALFLAYCAPPPEAGGATSDNTPTDTIEPRATTRQSRAAPKAALCVRVCLMGLKACVVKYADGGQAMHRQGTVRGSMPARGKRAADPGATATGVCQRTSDPCGCFHDSRRRQGSSGRCASTERDQVCFGLSLASTAKGFLRGSPSVPRPHETRHRVCADRDRGSAPVLRSEVRPGRSRGPRVRADLRLPDRQRPLAAPHELLRSVSAGRKRRSNSASMWAGSGSSVTTQVWTTSALSLPLTRTPLARQRVSVISADKASMAARSR